MCTVCEENKCVGCMACLDVCSKDAIKIEDKLSAYNAVIDAEKCVNCNACHKVCQNNTNVDKMAPNSWFQGWIDDQKVRSRCASGGVATALMQSFVVSGGIVYSCTFKNGKFIFESADSIDQVTKFAGSKYVKSNPIGVYEQINNQLIVGKKILFIGLPCQVAALKRRVNKKYGEYLYTVDLICHGSPSPRTLEYFLNQHGKSLKAMHDISFRRKNDFQLLNAEGSITGKNIRDRYSIAFLCGLSYTENCYECKYAELERVSDLTIGDSWGSSLEQNEVKRGVSLILCQNEKGQRLLKDAQIHLENVNLETAVQNNNQLNAPSMMPRSRKKFFKALRKGKNFDRTVLLCAPYQCFRQYVKATLIKLHIMGGGKIHL